MFLKTIKSYCDYNCFKGPFEFKFFPEKIICIIGENGSGKTTILNYIFDVNHNIVLDVGYLNVNYYNYRNYNNYNNNYNWVPKEIFEILKIEYFPQNFNKIFKKNNNNLNFQDLSSGEQELIKVFNFIFEIVNGPYQNNRPKIILLDEPDAHLNSKLRKEFIYLLKKYTKDIPNIQIIFTTHNTEVISDLKEEEVYLCKDNIIKNVGFNTYGERKDILEKKLFESKYNISKYVEKDIEDYREKIKSLKYIFSMDIIKEIEKLENEINVKFCEGIHKTELLRKLEELKK